MTLVEKTRALLEKFPAWWPVFVALIWLIWQTASWHQEIMDQLKTQEDQIKAMQEYLKTDHDHTKGFLGPPMSGLQLPQRPQDAKIPPL